MPSNLQYALAYARLGWSVLPLHYPLAKGICSCKEGASCGRVAKHPYGALVPHGVKDATTDPDAINRWWSKCPSANIGIATGSISGIIAIDVDPRHGGDSSLSALYESHSYTTATTQSATGGGGFHEIYAYPPDVGRRIQNKGGLNGLAGLDIRSDGGLIVAPPSMHGSGKRYRWKRGPNTTRPAKIPPWLSSILGRAPGSGVAEQTNWDSVFNGIANGNRDNTIFRYACYLRSLNLGRKQVEVLVQAAAKACPTPFPPAEATKKVEQAFKYPNEESTNGKEADSERATPRYISVETFTQWSRRNTYTDSWLVEDWLPRRSTGLVVGKSGSFKSYLTLHLLACIARGKPFLGKYPVHTGGKVILFQQEDAAMTTIKRMATILGVGAVRDVGPSEWEVPVPDTMGNNFLIETEHLLTFENPVAMGEFDEFIGDVKPVAVVLDPLNSLASAKDFMAGAPERMRTLKRLRDRHGTTFIVVHHTSKGTTGAGWEQIWGSQFLVGWKEFGWHLQKIQGESSVVVSRYTKDSAEPRRVRIDLAINECGIKFATSTVTAEQQIVFESEVVRRGKKEIHSIIGADNTVLGDENE